MNKPCATDTGRCVMCDGRLRNAVFCPVCGHSSCSWACHLRHLAQHAQVAGRVSTYQGEPARDREEGPTGAIGESGAGVLGQVVRLSPNGWAYCGPVE